MATAAAQAELIEDADFRQVVNPSSTIVVPLGASRGDTVQFFANGIPKNDYGLPLWFIRSDLLDWGHINAYGHIDQIALDSAAELLDYSDGYPLQKSGSPFWGNLTHEPFEAFKLFQAYLELVETEGIRLYETLSREQATPLKNIQELAKEYFWSIRARAYDLFVVAAEAKRRQALTRRTEASHFQIADGLLGNIIDRINDEPDMIKKLEPAELFDLMEKVMKIQRMSLGLVGQNASTNQNLPIDQGSTVEVILRQLTQKGGLSQEAGLGIQERLKALMGDENTALMAQELVIRATTGNEVHSNTRSLPPPPDGDV